jgi:CPA2 family monovalent cation:H+ antiporter-2
VLVGYGLAGHRLGQALKAAGVETLALELNAETVRNAQAAGEPVYLADATSAEALGHAHLAGARALVVAMNDPEGLRRVLAAARDAAPGVPVVVRTRFLSDVPALEALGAATVVVEEAEAAHALEAAVLAALARPAPSH